jgi:hypothetical protein
MIADFMTNPLHGEKFKKFQGEIMKLAIATQFMRYCDISTVAENKN